MTFSTICAIILVGIVLCQHTSTGENHDRFTRNCLRHFRAAHDLGNQALRLVRARFHLHLLWLGQQRLRSAAGRHLLGAERDTEAKCGFWCSHGIRPCLDQSAEPAYAIHHSGRCLHGLHPDFSRDGLRRLDGLALDFVLLQLKEHALHLQIVPFKPRGHHEKDFLENAWLADCARHHACVQLRGTTQSCQLDIRPAKNLGRTRTFGHRHADLRVLRHLLRRPCLPQHGKRGSSSPVRTCMAAELGGSHHKQPFSGCFQKGQSLTAHKAPCTITTYWGFFYLYLSFKQKPFGQPKGFFNTLIL